MVQARSFEIDGVVVPGHYVIIADDVVLLQADFNIVAMKRDGKMYVDRSRVVDGMLRIGCYNSIAFFFGHHELHTRQFECVDLNNGDLIR